ncbi:MAG: flagellar basal body-associated FliL family protein [Spirochaetaceae bacterium]|jgi:flagellar FliL protein|nr:flagellar basal body-associated FliL family protein [Spirochaetaceae bacterium]
MSDQELLDDGDAGGDEGEKKKSGGGRLRNLLPTLLKFVGIGLGAVILIVTVSVITYNLLSKGGKQQTAIPVTESYLGTKPQYQMFNLLGPITVRTKDPAYTVRVDMVIAYDENDNTSGAEFTSRQVEIRDFLRQYFRGKTAQDLSPENEARVKMEIQQQINTQILDKARIRKILFNTFDVMETG